MSKKDRIEWLQIQLAAQQRQLDNTSPSVAAIANIKEQMACDRGEIARLKRA